MQSKLMHTAGYITAIDDFGITDRSKDTKIAEHEEQSCELYNNGGALQTVNKLIKEIDMQSYDLDLKVITEKESTT